MRRSLAIALVIGFGAQGVAAFGRTWGLGTNLVTSHVIREERRSGPAVQPSLWVDIPQIRGLVTSWASVRLSNPRVDDAVLDLRAGIPKGTWGWIGGVAHWDVSVPFIDSVRSHSFEVGPVLTWFRPPYHPSFSLMYDLARRDGVLFVVSVPYTIRLPWFPPTTFIPEAAIRFAGQNNGLSAQYFSFSALLERRIGGVAVLPAAGVVPRGDVREWMFWAGLHINALR